MLVLAGSGARPMLPGCLGGSPVPSPTLPVLWWLSSSCAGYRGGNPRKTLEQAPHSPHPRLQASAHLLKNSALQPSYQFCHKPVSLACRSEEFSRRGWDNATSNSQNKYTM